MESKRHVALVFPDDYSTDQKGRFFEDFVAELLGPMQFRVIERVRFTGMEIDLLAKSIDRPFTVFVECKAQREALSADVISKLLGNVTLRQADAGWLFSTAELGSEARGQWEEIQAKPEIGRKFTWYPPERIPEMLLTQRAISDLPRTAPGEPSFQIGDATLVLSPLGRYWLVELLERGVPRGCSLFDAVTSRALPKDAADPVIHLSQRWSSLEYLEVQETNRRQSAPRRQASEVALVIAGDSWDDLRPARPLDFVGRDDIIRDVSDFLHLVRTNKSSTRAFAVQGPSGWGKSSLVLKLADLAKRGRLESCIVTAVDCRSAIDASFVPAAVKTALAHAAQAGVILPLRDVRVQSVTYPLDSPDVVEALSDTAARRGLVVLVFDQFEELFAKEQLLDTFNSIRELCLDVDARQLPFVTGFAWKTDIALPQQHPAYHLWHELADRRRAFAIREFGRSDILGVIVKAERGASSHLSPALKARLVEQCQGLPWLLKKLLVHIFKRVSTLESQYALLERELDVEILFKDDLAALPEDQLRCLRFVAQNSPVAVTDVEGSFSREVTNSLLGRHLLIRSGLNYAVYWDIFRDYLVENRVPSIPWARGFQRDPAAAMRVLEAVVERAPTTSPELAAALRTKDRPCQNILSDLVALQLVDRLPADRYVPAGHLSSVDPVLVAKHVRRQFERHVVWREVERSWEKGRFRTIDEWESLFNQAQPRSQSYARATVRTYASNFAKWLAFAGLLEVYGRRVRRPAGEGTQMGLVSQRREAHGLFLGSSAPRTLMEFLRVAATGGGELSIAEARSRGLRNAVTDAVVLGLAQRRGNDRVVLTTAIRDLEPLVVQAKEAIASHETIQAILEIDPKRELPIDELGRRLDDRFGFGWKPSSARRNSAGLRRFLEWAVGVA